MKVIGIDPGLQRTGYAIVESVDRTFKVVTAGVLKTEKSSIGKRLISIHKRLLEIIDKHSPSCLAVESAFYSKNVDSLVKMSQVKGVVILSATLKELEVFEYAPAVIKKAVVGRGRATKEQVKYMVEQITKQEIKGGFDVSDAIAVAICHLHRA